jgi:hypothetical protein
MTEIYVALLDEGTSVWRPVKATAVSGDLYKIDSAKQPRDEVWEQTVATKSLGWLSERRIADS